MEKAVKFRTIMNDPYREHPCEDALERFLFNQSDPAELEIVETHFLACESCVTRLEILELNIAAKKLALKNYQTEQAAKLAKSDARKNKAITWFTLPRLSFAGAGLAACALAILSLSFPREVNLIAKRGDETTVVQAWVPLNLHLQARELPAGPVTVEVVDKTGKQIFSRAATIRNEKIDLHAPRLAASGDYLVRVYAPTAGDPLGDLVREYPITAKPGF